MLTFANLRIAFVSSSITVQYSIRNLVLRHGGGGDGLEAAGAGALVLGRDVPGGVHPAVGLQHLLLHKLRRLTSTTSDERYLDI